MNPVPAAARQSQVLKIIEQRETGRLDLCRQRSVGCAGSSSCLDFPTQPKLGPWGFTHTIRNEQRQTIFQERRLNWNLKSP